MRLVDRLADAGWELRGELRGEILAVGEDAVPALLEIVEDAGDAELGWAPKHAAELLGELGATEAIEPMLKVLAEDIPDDAVEERIMASLRRMGPAVVEPALRAWRAGDAVAREWAACVLAEAGVRDGRIYEALLEQLDADPGTGAACLQAYGDPDALPHLCRALDDYEVVESDHPFANQPVLELRAAIEALGGVLTADHQRKIRRVRRVRDRFGSWLERPPGVLLDRWADRDVVMPVRREPKLGRNEPCWCGSGAKYKKCHLREDEDHA